MFFFLILYLMLLRSRIAQKCVYIYIHAKLIFFIKNSICEITKDCSMCWFCHSCCMGIFYVQDVDYKFLKQHQHMIQNTTNGSKHRWMQRWKTKRVLKTNYNEKHQMQVFSETFRKHKILGSSSKTAHEIYKMWQTPEKNSRCKGQGTL